VPETVRTVGSQDKLWIGKQCLVLTEHLVDLDDDSKSHFMCFSEPEVASEVNTMVSTFLNVRYTQKFKKNVMLLNQGRPIEASMHYDFNKKNIVLDKTDTEGVTHT